MFWRNPTYFWLILAVLALEVVLILALRWRREQLRAFAEANLVPRLAPDVDQRRRNIRIALRLVTLVLMIVALAGPKWGFEWEQVKRQGIDLIVAIDTSRSMLATDVKPNRLERAKLAVLDLVRLMEGDRVGLVPFAGTAFLECPLTLDRAAFERSLHAVDVGIIPRGGTSLSRAIETSLDGFEARQGKYEALILITDGEDNEGDAEETAKRAAEHGVKIYTIGIGTPEGELIPSSRKSQQGFVKDRQGQVVKSRLNEDVLQKIALASGGAYVRGSGASLGLDEIFNEHIAKMERREVASTLERRYEERFQIPLAIALVFLVLELLMGERRGLRPRRWWRSETASRASTTALLVLLSPLLVGWLDPPGDRAAEGNRLYEQGKFNEAADKYGEGLVDAPESPLLQFNRGAALYKQGKYAEAITALTKVAASPNNEWAARAAFNLGNAQYQLAANAEQSDPQSAITSYEQAKASYKRSMGADPRDDGAKFNHELADHKIVELKKRIEEERKKKEEEQKKQEEQKQESQDQQEQQQQDQEQGQDEQQQDQEQEQQDQQAQDQQEQNQSPEQQSPEQQQQRQEQAGEQQQQQDEQQQPQEQAAQDEPQQDDQQEGPGGQGTAVAGEEGEKSPEEQAAQAVMDVARDEELGPEDVKRPVRGGGIAEPARDW